MARVVGAGRLGVVWLATKLWEKGVAAGALVGAHGARCGVYVQWCVFTCVRDAYAKGW